MKPKNTHYWPEGGEIPWSDDAVVGWEGRRRAHGPGIDTFVRPPGQLYLERLESTYNVTGALDCLDALTDFSRAISAESEETRLERELRERWGKRFAVHWKPPGARGGAGSYTAGVDWRAVRLPIYTDNRVTVERRTKLAALRALAAATKALDEVTK